MIGEAIPYIREISGTRESSLIYPVHIGTPTAFAAVNGHVREFFYSRNDPHLDTIVAAILAFVEKRDFDQSARTLKSMARKLGGPRPEGNYDEQEPIGVSMQTHGACCRHLVGCTYAALKLAGIPAEMHCGPLVRGEKHSYLIVDDSLAVDPINARDLPVSQLNSPYTPNTRTVIEPLFLDASGSA